jgi:tryptophan 7-halogenase
MKSEISKVVIVGGGTSGWMTAAMLAKMFKQTLEIHLVESEDIGTIGVGEASIPPLKLFNNALGIPEAEFIHATQASIKLGIEFEHWGQQGERYMHAFGNIGKDLGLTPFHHFWLKSQQTNTSDFWQFSVNYQAAKQNKFAPLESLANNQMAGITHAYHFDANLYAKLLRQYSQQAGVNRHEGKIVTTKLDTQGNIESLELTDGRVIKGDLFIDCSGFAALLIGQALKVDYDNWQHWLPCDSAYAVPSTNSGPLKPYTQSIAHAAGWQWRIPLQHRTGNGLVYCSQYMSDEAAKQLLLQNLEGEALAEPRKISFTTGRRVKQWHKNCVSIGLSSGFLEPLESTSIHLVQSAITRLIKCFPNQGIKDVQVAEFNRQSQKEFEQIRDFIILHYHLNQKNNDAGLWQYCREMTIPESLQRKIDLFRTSGTVFREQDELFTEAAWVQVLLGQGITPEDYHPLANGISGAELTDFLGNMKSIISASVSRLPSHEHFLASLLLR